MKKLLALLLTFAMVLSLAACGTSGESTGDDNSAPDSQQTQQQDGQQQGDEQQGGTQQQGGPQAKQTKTGELTIFDQSAIIAIRIEGEYGGDLKDRQASTTGIYSIFEHSEWVEFYPVGDAEVIDIYYFTHDEKADYSKKDAQWLDDNGRHFTRLYNQKNESFPDGYWGASYFDQDMGTGYFDFVFATEEKAVAVMKVQVFEEFALQGYTDDELIALNDGKAVETPQDSQSQTDNEKLVSAVLNLSAFGKDSEGNPYKWQVLDVDTENNKALLLMDGYSDGGYMFADDELHTWENCQVREYLNFQSNMEAMFTQQEQQLILKTTVRNEPNPQYGISTGNDTSDYLFLLSVQEMEKYFENPKDRVVYDADGNPVAQYLRTAGGQENYFAIIRPDDSGEIDYYGSHGYTEALAIRPAMWVDISGTDVEDIQNTPAPTAENKPEPTPTDEKEDEPNNPPASVSGFVTTKTGKFYSAFTGGTIKMDYELVSDGQTLRMITATKGDKAYVENYTDGQSTGCSVIDGKDMYVIEHSSKFIIKMALEADLLTVASKVVTENDIDMAQLEKGKREIDGVTYDTESWVMEGDKVTMCFDGDALAYIITQPGDSETVIKILDYSTDVDDSLFTIPSGYTVLDMTA